MIVAETGHDADIKLTIKQLIQLQRHAVILNPSNRYNNQALAGEQHSRFRGRGMDFDEVRQYLPGDEIRHMDWRVTARTGRPHTKLYRDERERPVFMVVDYNPSMFFGTRTTFKSVIASQAAAYFSWCHMLSGDRVGGIMLAGDKHRELRPQGGNRGLLPLLNSLVDFNNHPSTNKTAKQGLSVAFSRLRHVARPGSLIYILSDFYQFNNESQQLFHQLAQHGEICLVYIYDPLEKDPPPANVYTVTNGMALHRLDTHNNSLREKYREQFLQRYNLIYDLSKKHRLAFLPLATNDEIIDLLKGHFSQ